MEEEEAEEEMEKTPKIRGMQPLRRWPPLQTIATMSWPLFKLSR